MPPKKIVKKPTRRTTKPTERYVLVTTEHRGIFAGWATDTSGKTVKLRGGRNVFYFAIASEKGFVGLATVGPASGSKIGPPCDMELRNITAVLEVSDIACIRFEGASWS